MRTQIEYVAKVKNPLAQLNVEAFNIFLSFLDSGFGDQEALEKAAEEINSRQNFRSFFGGAAVSFHCQREHSGAYNCFLCRSSK